MTREEIENMHAGVEMDAMIANSVMGWKDLKPEEVKTAIEHDMLLSFSSDIAAAWEVIIKMNSLGFNVYVGELLPYRGLEENLSVCRLVRYEDEEETKIIEARAETAPLAICRAALLAVMENNQ